MIAKKEKHVNRERTHRSIADLTGAYPRVSGAKLLLTAAVALILAIGVPLMAGATANANAPAPSLGAAANFAVLAGAAVTCTNATVTGNVGVFPGSAITQTTCPIIGTIDGGDAIAAPAATDAVTASTALAALPCDSTLTGLGSLTLAPGVYCFDAAATETGGALTLRGPQVDDEIVDVEALILGSLGLAHKEPRLRTLATDWTIANSELLSIARIRALLEGPFAGTDVSISEVAQRASTEGGDARWRALVSGEEEHRTPAPSTRKRAIRAATPRWRGARTLLLQLRRGLGVGVKADLIAILIGKLNEWVDVSTLCELSLYSVAGVRRAADDMADAGLIETSGGHSRAYRANVRAWQTLFPNLESPTWRRRADGFAFVLRWQRYVVEKSASHDSELSLAISFGARMTEFWRLWLEAGVTQLPVSETSANAWESRMAAFESLKRWFEDRAQYGDEYDGEG